tara:strand:- start:62 stop:478 length:417 start_codon:yes stop_codon:yes gene_type:complete
VPSSIAARKSFLASSKVGTPAPDLDWTLFRYLSNLPLPITRNAVNNDLRNILILFTCTPESPYLVDLEPKIKPFIKYARLTVLLQEIVKKYFIHKYNNTIELSHDVPLKAGYYYLEDSILDCENHRSRMTAIRVRDTL